MTLTTPTTTTPAIVEATHNDNIIGDVERGRERGGQGGVRQYAIASPISTATTATAAADNIPSRQQQQEQEQHQFCFGYCCCYGCNCNMRNTVYITNIMGIIISIIGIMLFAFTPFGFNERMILPDFVYVNASDQYQFRIYFTFLLNITFHSLSQRGIMKHIDWMLRISTAWFMLLVLIPLLVKISKFNYMIDEPTTTNIDENYNNSNRNFFLLIMASIVWNVLFVIYPHCVLIREARLGISLQPLSQHRHNQW